MKIHPSIALIALLAVATPARADGAPQNWKVSEGVGGSTKGVWTVTVSGGALVGQSRMTTIANQPLGYKLTGTLAAGTYAFQTTSSSDGRSCSYSGQLGADGVTIRGTQSCGGASAPWVAVTSLGM